MGGAGLAHAQTSGSWIVDANGTWAVSTNWDPAVPGGGGVATFGLLSNSTSGHTVTNNSSVTLGSIVFNTPFTFTINGGGAFTLNGAATIDAQDGAPNAANLFPPGHSIGISIGGSAGLTKSGNASVQLTAANSFTGGVTISGGALYVTDNLDSSLGNSANSITLSNGAALANTAADGTTTFSSARNITLGTGGGELRNFAPMSLSGVISGSGNLVKRGNGLGSATLTLTGSNTYIGQTTVRDNDMIRLSGANGAIASSAQINLSGTLYLDNATTVNNNRVGTVPIVSNGGAIQLTGNSASNVNETVGTISLDGGMSLINIVGTASNTRLNATALSRVGRSTGFVRGDSLGAGNAGSFTNLIVTNAPTLVGGGGLAGSTNISIVPWLIGNGSASLVLNSSGDSFVTYGADGFRPLNKTTEYASTLVTGANVRLTSATSNASPVSVNSLAITNVSLSGAGTVTVSSGAVALVSAGGSIGTPLAFGANEGIIHATSSGTITGVISGANGLTKTGWNGLTLTGSNTYTGTTTIVAGQLMLSSNVPNGGTPNPLGLSTSAVEMYGGTGVGVPRIYAAGGGSIQISRDLTINNSTADSTGVIGTAVGASATTLTYAGTVTVNGGLLRFEGDPSPAMNITGNITGSGRVSDAFGSAQVLSGNNDYTGGTTVLAGTYWAGSDSAFGAGSIVFSNTTLPTIGNPRPGAIGAFDAPRTIANPVLVAAPGPATDPALLGMVITGAQPLTLSGSIDLGGQERAITVASSANTTMSGVISRGGILKQGSGRLILSGSNSYTGNTTVVAGTLSFGATESNTALTIQSGANAEVLAGGDKVLVLRSLTVAGGATPTATIDLADNDMKLSSGSYSTVAAQIRNARSVNVWTLAGITSSTARDDALHVTGLGLLSGTEFHSARGVSATFDGFAVANSDLLVKYTWNGDSDFNGAVDFDDYARIDNGYNSQTDMSAIINWFTGDFDYNGRVDFDDYALIDFAFNSQSGTLGRAMDAIIYGTTNYFADPGVGLVLEHAAQFGSEYVSAFVPEPVAGIFVVAVAELLRNRRRKKSLKNGVVTKQVCRLYSGH